MVLVLLLASASAVTSQVLPNPYRQHFKSGGLGPADAWAKLPAGRTMGAVGDLKMDPDGRHLWAVVRCDATAVDRFGNECLDSNLDPIVKFDMEGNTVTSFGSGTVIWPHGIDIGPDGRVYVADRGNNRVQIFDLEGEFIDEWAQFGTPSGIAFDDQGQIYVSDSESDDFQNPGFEMGIRVGEYETGWVTSFILYPWGDPRDPGGGTGAEFVAVDREGNIYGGEPRPRRIQKYVQVRP